MNRKKKVRRQGEEEGTGGKEEGEIRYKMEGQRRGMRKNVEKMEGRGKKEVEGVLKRQNQGSGESKEVGTERTRVEGQGRKREEDPERMSVEN